MKFIIGSRGSKLALWQAEWVKRQLEKAGYETEIKVITTTGDKLAAVSLVQSGTKGLFIKEIEEALLDGSADIAVHSLKDLPVEQPDGLSIAAVPPREDARDVLISRDGQKLEDLPPGSRAATSSLRRQSQLRHLRPDLEVIPIRGNVDTRLRKLEDGGCEALVMAAAGIHRLGFQARIAEYFSPECMCPAAGQGALAIEIRKGDEKAERAVTPLDHPLSHRAVRAERAMLRRLGGGCQTPIAAHATVKGDGLAIIGVVASPDGAKLIRVSGQGAAGDPEAAGERIAEKLLEQGAEAILNASG